MRVYKSPLQTKPSQMQKKSSINFVKNVAAPKHSKPQNNYNCQNLADYENANVSKHFGIPSIDKYRNNTVESLCLIIKHQQKIQQVLSTNSSKNIKQSILSNKSLSSKKAIKVFFPYNSNTQIKNLISFVHNQIQNNMLFIKSSNIYIDYILGLKQYKVVQLVQCLKSEQQLKRQNDEEQSKQIIGGKTSNSKNSILQLQIICCQYRQMQNSNYLKNFQIIKCVGSGGFSKVFLVRGFGKLMAMKVIDKNYIIQNDKSNIINNQKTILSICSDHPFITKLFTSFQTKNYLIFAMEFCNGGQLFNLLRKVRRMKQQDAKFYFLQTLSAIFHLHRKGIVYRDIKPQNIIIDYQGHVRLADYGLSKIMEDSRQSKTYSFCGSAEYMAPQMLLKKGHSYQIDFYCLGALLYQLVTGLPPYYSRNQNQLFSNIIYNDLEFPVHVSLSQQIQMFLEKLLQKQVQNRYKSLEEILSDPWLKNTKFEDILQRKLKPPFKTDMFGYNFDDADFADQQKQVTQKLIDQQKQESFQEFKFLDFFFQSKQIKDLKLFITKAKQQGLFIRSSNNQIGQFIAESYNKRTPSQSGSIILNNKISRQPSINRLQNSSFSNIPTNSVIITKRQGIQMTPKYTESNKNSQVVYYPQAMKQSLHTVRSLQNFNTSKSSLNNRSHQRIGSINKKVDTYNSGANIYTTHKQPFQTFGVKVSTSSSSLIGQNSHHPKSVTYIRQPNYYSVQKSNNRYQGARLDIQNLSIKNQRNYSVQKIKDIYSSPNFNIAPHYTPQNFNNSLKHVVSAYQLKKSYMDGFKDRIMIPSKVKKQTPKNGQKISISMLNNVHYRN